MLENDTRSLCRILSQRTHKDGFESARFPILETHWLVPALFFTDKEVFTFVPTTTTVPISGHRAFVVVQLLVVLAADYTHNRRGHSHGWVRNHLGM